MNADDDAVPTSAPDDENALFEEFRRSRRRPVRNQIVERHQGLAIHIARRYARPGSEDDVRQVALLGLVKAVDRFDPGRDVAFSTFAGRTIEGEIKRHFRDATWAVRVPRGAKELHLAVRAGNEELGRRTGRSPTVDELAQHLGLEKDEVLAGLVAGEAQHSSSLQRDRTDDEASGGTTEAAALATIEAGYEHAEQRHLVEGLLEHIDDRSRRIVALRFYDQLTQSEIAEREGISQMHVSRLLRRAIEQLRRAPAG